MDVRGTSSPLRETSHPHPDVFFGGKKDAPLTSHFFWMYIRMFPLTSQIFWMYIWMFSLTSGMFHGCWPGHPGCTSGCILDVRVAGFFSFFGMYRVENLPCGFWANHRLHRLFLWCTCRHSLQHPVPSLFFSVAPLFFEKNQKISNPNPEKMWPCKKMYLGCAPLKGCTP